MLPTSKSYWLTKSYIKVIKKYEWFKIDKTSIIFRNYKLI